MRRTVVVVEDEDPCATTLEIALGQIPELDIRVVHTAEAARDMIETGTDVCAVVTDLNLPNASGMELIQWVRASRANASLPIIVISGETDRQAPARARTLGANAFFSKPFSPAEVRRRLEDLIHGK
ncbi:MAG TPA: response regulator [Bryobacteraceae bacterium]|nr:response regulator [Bryobacteraceae bacterium]